jgi:PadR family transcriptional regulator PadR
MDGRHADAIGGRVRDVLDILVVEHGQQPRADDVGSEDLWLVADMQDVDAPERTNIAPRSRVYSLQCSHMTEIYLGELEQIVLLAMLRLGDEAYAVPVLAQIEAQTGRKLARGALYTALDRLETKGCLRSRVGEPLPERGGRARRYFTVTPAAVRALKASRLTLMRLWRGLEQLL